MTVTLLLVLSAGKSTAQTIGQGKEPFATVSMAKKIGNYCLRNQQAFALFATANEQQVQRREDLASRLLENLDEHLDCAESFLFTLYWNYGVEMSYHYLKRVGFTIKEIDIAENAWKKEQERLDASIKEKEELAMQKRLEQNDIFTKKELESSARINWQGIESIYDNQVAILFEYGNAASAKCQICVDKDGTLVTDGDGYNFFTEYVLRKLQKNKHIPAKIKFKGNALPVKSQVVLQYKSITNPYSFPVRKSKNGWLLKEKGMNVSDREKSLMRQLMSTIANEKDLSELKNKTYTVKAKIITFYIENRYFVQETNLEIWKGEDCVFNKHYPFTKYKALEEEKIKVVHGGLTY